MIWVRKQRRATFVPVLILDSLKPECPSEKKLNLLVAA
jgi:hypothetical protein